MIQLPVILTSQRLGRTDKMNDNKLQMFILTTTETNDSYLNKSATKLPSGQRQDQVPEVNSPHQVLLVLAEEFDDGVTLVVAHDTPQAQHLDRLSHELL